MKWLTNPYVLLGAAAIVAVYFNGRSRFLDVCQKNSASPGNCPRLLAMANPWDVFLFGVGVSKGGAAGAPAAVNTDDIELG